MGKTDNYLYTGNEYTFRADLHVIRGQMLCNEIAMYQQ